MGLALFPQNCLVECLRLNNAPLHIHMEVESSTCIFLSAVPTPPLTPVPGVPTPPVLAPTPLAHGPSHRSCQRHWGLSPTFGTDCLHFNKFFLAAKDILKRSESSQDHPSVIVLGMKRVKTMEERGSGTRSTDRVRFQESSNILTFFPSVTP